MASNQIVNEQELNKIPEHKRTIIDRWRLILGKKAEEHEINFSPKEENNRNNQKNPSKNKDREKNPKENKNTSHGQKKIEIGGQGKQFNKKKINGGSQTQSKREIMRKTIKANRTADNQPNNIKGKTKRGGNQKLQINKFHQIDDTLNFVYGPRNEKRSAGLESSRFSIPKWIENVKKLFPQQSKEVLEKDLVERSDLKDIIQNPELFEKVEPSLDMVKVIINLKHMLPENVKIVARKIVKKVVNALKNKFKQEVEKHIVGALKRDKHTPIKVFKNIDWKQSIKKNLKNYDPKLKKLIMGEPRFFSAERRKKPWQIIVLIDESGSMTDSVIYSVVMASIFASLPSIHTNLIIFDTQVVDLSSKIDDPVDILMSVQLGGGTDITKAVRYGQSLIKNPKKTIMVIISDFYEGRGYDQLTRALKRVLEGQTKILGIAALGHNSEPVYDRRYAKIMNEMGIDIIACTPKNLPELISRLMK